MHCSLVIKAVFRRTAINDYEFSDGYKVRKGDMVILNQRQILQDSAYYPEPLEFRPFRFVQYGKDQGPAERSDKNTQWSTTYSHSWPFWGTARQTW